MIFLFWHCGRQGITPPYSRMALTAMSCQRWPERWRASMAASAYFRSFSLMRSNRRIKAKMNGPPHSRPKCLTLRSRSAFSEGKRQAPLCEGQAFSSSLRRAPLPFWPGPRAHPGWVLAFPHITNHLSDSKRLQSTTNVCSTA